MSNGETAADKKFGWIKARLDEGRTVYLTTMTRATKITKKHLPLVRVREGNLEVLQGKAGWLNHNYSRLSAV